MALEILDLATIVSSRLVNDAAVAVWLPIYKLTLYQNTMVNVEHLADAIRLIVDHLTVVCVDRFELLTVFIAVHVGEENSLDR